MKWIEPIRDRKKPKRCEFCDADVYTPFLGVHDEVEIFSGIPVPCRNNGRLNAHIAFPNLIQQDGPTPKEGFKWFVEHPETHLWWSGYAWTNDPYLAFGCDLEQTADRYARFQHIQNYVITEHEFVNPKSK